MRYTTFLILPFVLISLSIGCSSSPPPPVQAAPSSAHSQNVSSIDYILQPGDQLDIKFFYNPEINEEVIIRPDGKISLQLVDEITAAGLTPAQLDNLITQKYAKELKNPMVTVILQSFAGLQVFVGGEVNEQGIINLTAGMTPLQAIINAGGLTEEAKPSKALIIRKGYQNKPVPIEVDLSDAIRGNSDQKLIALQPYDIIYVPKSGIAKANKFVNQYIENLLLFRGVSFGFSYRLDDYPDF